MLPFLLQFHCESSIIDDENIVSLILSDTKRYAAGDSYRFCLVLTQSKNVSRDLVVGCSNITKLKGIEAIPLHDDGDQDEEMDSTFADDSTTIASRRDVSDIATFDKITSNSDDIWYKTRTPIEPKTMQSRIANGELQQSEQTTHDDEPNVSVEAQPSDNMFAYQLMHGLNNSFLPGLGIGILLASIFVMLYGVARMRNDRNANTAVTTCYAANDHVADMIDCEHRNRYLKLQATTTL